MEAVPKSARKQAAKEATQWVLRLQEEPEDGDLRRRFRQWCDSSSLNAAAWSATQHASELARAVLPDYAKEWEPLVARPRTRRRSKRRWLLPLAASALAACIAAFTAPTVVVQLQADHSTGTAELRTVALPDGSEVTLAPYTSIAVSFSRDERRVRLLSGEAFFAVKHDPGRPFEVAARSVETSVLGTRFDVLMDDKGVIVSVEQGAVGVKSTALRDAPERLEAGHSVRLTWAGQSQRASESPQLMASWRRGQLYLQDQPLKEAIERLRGYFGGSIILADTVAGDRRVTGVYNLSDPEEALRGMAEVIGVKVRKMTPWLLVVSSS